MKKLIVGLVAVGIIGVLCNAEDTASKPDTAGPGSSSSKANAPTPEENAFYAKLRRGEFELSTKLKLLTELTEEHVSKAEEAQKAEQTEKAGWENELVQGLRERISVVSKQLSAVTKQRQAFEETYNSVDLTINAANPAEIAFLAKLEERLTKVRQELTAMIEAGNSYTLELLTNNTPEVMRKVSFQTQENGKQVKDLEREQADLELKKLEFQALRR